MRNTIGSDVSVDIDELRNRVQGVYREVATRPDAEFHFEVGRPLAERLGYRPRLLDEVPRQAVDSFAGVGCPFELASLPEGGTVLDLGSGSGMDSLYAARLVGSAGRVIGIDMTREQLAQAAAAADEAGVSNLELREAYIESLPLQDESVDAVLSNGVINLSAYKTRVFDEISRVLRSGGSMAISDIVSERPLTEEIVCDASLWAACIGGAAPEADYLRWIDESGLEVRQVRTNDQYGFLSRSAQNATRTFGVKSITVLAVKP